jgi:DNA-binding response OmpR family regulator
MKLLIVEDEHKVVDYLRSGLTEQGWVVDVALDGEEGMHLATEFDYDVIVLDVMLPKRDGFSVLKALRMRKSTPVIMLTARDHVNDRVRGLREGADDYLAKPFAMEELVARLQALLRRPGHLLGRLLSFGNVSLDTEGRQVFVGGTARAFPARETAVLEILLRRGGNVAPKRLFEDQLFGLSGDVGSNAVEVYVHRLRKMLGDAGASVKIHTVRGVGYLMAEEKAG